MKKLFLLLLPLLSILPASAQLGVGDIDLVQLRKLQLAQMAIKSLYVDTINLNQLTENAIRGMLEQLDPHSTYVDPKETKSMTENLDGNFEGIGVQFNILEDTLVVIQTISKGPSEKVGILAGDRIVSVDGQPIAGVKMERDSIMRLLRGPKGTKVRLGVVRRSVKDHIYFNVTRDKIPVNTLDAAYMIAPGVGYIHLDRFGANSGTEVREAIVSLKAQGMEKLIFDLQNNGGGYLEAAREVAQQFLPGGSLVVFTEGREVPAQKLFAGSEGEFRTGDLIILVNEYTASAAEIVSGAVQDHDRGRIVGRRTFGKGLVQRPIELPDGSMIRLTVAHYYTPSGRCIQKPYVKGDRKDYERDVLNRLNHGELTSLDSIHLDSTKVYRTLGQGRTVYGGGGIMPDVFVPLDTTKVSTLYATINRNNIIVDVTLKYADKNRKSLLRKYKKFDDYVTSFEVPQELIDEVFDKARAKGIEAKDDSELQAATADLHRVLKALIAYNVWDRNEYFRLTNMENDIVGRALELMQGTK